MECNINSEGYKKGYKDGYSWLTSGGSFKHPLAPLGYIPGGPYVFIAYRYDPPEFQEKAKASQQNNHDWICGWKIGINAYVRKAGLPYPEVM